jgi:anti-sigma B factor antagonist
MSAISVLFYNDKAFVQAGLDGVFAVLEVNFESADNIALVKFSGRIDSMSAGVFGEALCKPLEHGQVNVVADLSDVEYMSSAGLREIVTALKKLKKASGDLRLAGVTARVTEIFEMSGLDTVLKIYHTPNAAIASY